MRGSWLQLHIALSNGDITWRDFLGVVMVVIDYKPLALLMDQQVLIPGSDMLDSSWVIPVDPAEDQIST